jgi:hypothetical protein
VFNPPYRMAKESPSRRRKTQHCAERPHGHVGDPSRAGGNRK